MYSYMYFTCTKAIKPRGTNRKQTKEETMYFNSRSLKALSPEDIARRAPAVYASAPKETTSDNYLFIPTARLVDGLASNGWDVVAAKQSMNRASSVENRETNKHALFLARQDDLRRGVGYGESLPLLKLTNSHNGMSTFSLSSGFFRVVCANGLTVPDSVYQAPKVRHVRDMAQEVIDATYKVLNDFPRLIQMQKDLSGIELSQDERFLLADAAADIFFTKTDRERMNAIAKKSHNDRYLLESQLIAAKRYDDRKNDLWTVSNVIQENLIRGNVQLADETLSKTKFQRKVTSIDRDNDIHEKLFKLTQKFAELKGLKIGAA